MNKQELESKIEWNEYGIGQINLFAPVFNQEIKFEIFPEYDSETISEKMFLAVNDILVLLVMATETINSLLWEEFHFSFRVSDYGFEPNEGETDLEAHYREMEVIENEDLLAKSTIKCIQINFDNDKFEGRYAEIIIDTPSDNLISIVVKNGEIIDFGSNGLYIGWFEKDDKYLQNKRQI
jgi:hypothetical protein